MGTPNIRDVMELGNTYAANKQWDSAAPTFAGVLDQIYGSLKQELPAPIDARWYAELRHSLSDESYAKIWRPSEDRSIEVDGNDLLKGLREHIVNAQHSQRLSAQPYVTFFSFVSPSSNRRYWTVVFYNYEQTLPIEKPSREVSRFPLVKPGSFSVVLRLDPADKLRFWLVTKEADQKAYAWAHMAQARVATVKTLYSQYQILDDTSVPAMLEGAMGYRRALLLKPGYSWALAHFGEVFRDIANSWTSQPKLKEMAEARIRSYMHAIQWFRAAIDQDPNNFWAKAHLGATVVNMRAFIGIHQDKMPDELQHLLKEWLGAPSIRGLIDKGIELLVQALELRGYFFPWAQGYYGGALLLKAAVKGSGVNEPDQGGALDSALAIHSMAQIGDSHFLDPGMMASGFEPDRLYVNPFFELGCIFFFVEQYSLAWQYLWIGMRWLFKFNFLPGLQGLIGCEMLVAVATKYIEKGCTDKSKKLIIASGLDVSSDLDFPIPKEVIDKKETLAEFICHAFERFCLPFVSPFLPDDVKINTNIAMGLQATLVILYYFERRFLDIKYPVPPMMTVVINKIKKKIDCASQIEFYDRLTQRTPSDKCENELSDEEAYAIYEKKMHDDMFSRLETGRLTYSVLLALNTME